MQSEETQGGKAQDCGAAAGEAAKDQTRVHEAAQHVLQQVRVFAEQYEVFIRVFVMVCARRLIQTCACGNEQEKVRVLTAENAALRLQIAQQAERSQSDAQKQVCGVCLLHTQMRFCHHRQILEQVCRHFCLHIHSRCRIVHGTVHLVACATQERPKKPAACVLYHVRLCYLLAGHVLHLCALRLRVETDVYNT
jgi:hypothetical protein